MLRDHMDWRVETPRSFSTHESSRIILHKMAHWCGRSAFLSITIYTCTTTTHEKYNYRQLFEQSISNHLCHDYSKSIKFVTVAPPPLCGGLLAPPSNVCGAVLFPASSRSTEVAAELREKSVTLPAGNLPPMLPPAAPVPLPPPEGKRCAADPLSASSSLSVSSRCFV